MPSRQHRMHMDMQSRTLTDCSHGKVVRLDDIILNHPMSNIDHAIQDLHDILHAYYKVARKRFVDSLRMQAADHFLTTGPQTPLKLFSPAFVAGMTLKNCRSIHSLLRPPRQRSPSFF